MEMKIGGSCFKTKPCKFNAKKQDYGLIIYREKDEGEFMREIKNFLITRQCPYAKWRTLNGSSFPFSAIVSKKII